MATNTQNPSAPTSAQAEQPVNDPMVSLINGYLLIQKKNEEKREQEKAQATYRCNVLIASGDPILTACGLIGAAWETLVK